MPAANRRRHARFRVRNLVAHLQVEGRLAVCSVEDISQGGLLLRTTERLDVGTPVLIDLARPGLKKPLRVSGIVATVRGRAAYGVQLDQPSGEDTMRLLELLRDLARMDPTAISAAHARATTSSAPPPVEPPAAPPPMAAMAVPVPAPEPVRTGDESRLMLQIRGLLLQLDQAQQALREREEECAALREEVEQLRAAAASRRESAPEAVDAVRREAVLAAEQIHRLLEAAKQLR